MTSDLAEPQPPPAASNEQAEALLDTANSGSQHVAVLHVAFMALCTYVLVIVFGTTDMDLLIGKDVQLPVVDVKVPIVGFYAVAPYLVMLVHFNLLLQLLLLSRQLYAFDTAAPQEKRIGGLHDRLHIFLYAYYLVGRLSPFLRWLLGFVTGITLLVLPLATLLMLQLRFLAYQHQAITWMQRVAVWFSVALVIALWPVIMNPGPHDSWHDYLRQRWIMGLGGVALWLGFVLLGFVTTQEVYFKALWTILVLLIFFAAVGALARLWRWWRRRRHEPEGGVSVPTREFRGMPGLLLVVALGVPLPLGLLADGEWWEEELLGANVVASEVVYDWLRFLDLNEQVILAKPAKPELIAQFREGNPEKVKEALKQVEPVNLRGRNLRRANLSLALLLGADLAQANLQGANLHEARLQGAELQGAQLQGADLSAAQLQYTNLRRAQLQGAYLAQAQLQGADLTQAQLQGAILSYAQLQGADLRSAQLYAAQLHGAVFDKIRTALVDLRGARWTPLNAGRLRDIREVMGKTIPSIPHLEVALALLEGARNAGVPLPTFESCLIGPDVTPELNCEQKWLPTEVEAFRGELFPVLEKLTCGSSAIARGLIRQIDASQTRTVFMILRARVAKIESGRLGLAGRFAALLDKKECEGLSSLPDADKNRIRDLVRRENEFRARSAGKSMKDVPPSPTPPPAIAPATP